MTAKEILDCRINRMVKSGLSRKYAQQVIASDRNPRWRPSALSQRVEPRIKPWRCPKCGVLIEVAGCLSCFVEGKRAAERDRAVMEANFGRNCLEKGE